MGVWGLRFGVWGLGFEVWGLGFACKHAGACESHEVKAAAAAVAVGEGWGRIENIRRDRRN